MGLLGVSKISQKFLGISEDINPSCMFSSTGFQEVMNAIFLFFFFLHNVSTDDGFRISKPSKWIL